MKSILFTITLIFALSILQAKDFSPATNPSELAVKAIDNGWYNATVSYYNSTTYQKSTYTLSVKVDYDRVTVIDFGNGGSVHSGYNNSGYIYSGGSLSMKKDYEGNIVSATTRVSVSDSNGIRSYDISFQ